MSRFHWSHDTLVIDNTVVGCIAQGASGDWLAYGCMDDWQDTPLGSFEKRKDAQRTILEWAEGKL